MNSDEGLLNSLDRRWLLALRQRNIPEVILTLEEMAKAGGWTAAARIGEMYEMGFKDGDAVFGLDTLTAENWYWKAVHESNDPLAHLGLGRMYYHNALDSSSNVDAARFHLEIAYVNGFPLAGILLGLMCVNGIGREIDLPAATRYFEGAAEGGFPAAYGFLAWLAASKGDAVRGIKMLVRQFALTMRLRLLDWHHPNLLLGYRPEQKASAPFCSVELKGQTRN